jgi:hypothetical protein
MQNIEEANKQKGGRYSEQWRREQAKRKSRMPCRIGMERTGSKEKNTQIGAERTGSTRMTCRISVERTYRQHEDDIQTGVKRIASKEDNMQNRSKENRQL